MEALLEREADVENWNDDRLDELSRRLDAGFDQVGTKVEVSGVKGEVANVKGEVANLGEEMRRGFAKVDKEFDNVTREFGRLNDRFDKLLWGIGFVGLTIGLNIVADKI